jgi:hypothetical protein
VERGSAFCCDDALSMVIEVGLRHEYKHSNPAVGGGNVSGELDCDHYKLHLEDLILLCQSFLPPTPPGGSGYNSPKPPKPFPSANPPTSDPVESGKCVTAAANDAMQGRMDGLNNDYIKNLIKDCKDMNPNDPVWGQLLKYEYTIPGFDENGDPIDIPQWEWKFFCKGKCFR